MAMLASKSPFSRALGSSAGVSSSAPPTSAPPSASRRALGSAGGIQTYPSPTESDFSDADGHDAVRSWDEERVGEYLRSINCGEYQKLFSKNHINGKNLLELDKAVLQEMGIDKVGDRVRLFLGIKKLRTKAHANQKKRNRVSWLTPGSPIRSR